MNIASLHVYPIKSCGGIQIDKVSVLDRGFAFDREFMVVDEMGKFISQRTHPKLCLVRTVLEENSLGINTPIGSHCIDLSLSSTIERRVTIWKDTCTAVDQGHEASDLFSDFLGQRCFLVRYDPLHIRMRYSETLRRELAVSFADSYGLLVISQESLELLNSKLTEPVPMERFRPNIVLSNCRPHEEDVWSTLQGGDLDFGFAEVCERCAIPTTNQNTAERAKEPSKTLATYRRILFPNQKGVYFGSNYYVKSGHGTLRTGDILRAS